MSLPRKTVMLRVDYGEPSWRALRAAHPDLCLTSRREDAA